MASHQMAEPASKRAKVASCEEEWPFPLLDITSTQTLEWCKSLPPPPVDYADDVFICSYPKSGTTWLQHIVGSLIVRAYGKSQGDDAALPHGHVSQRSPFFEIDPHWIGPGELAPHVVKGHAALGRRLFNTHLRWEMMPKHDRARYVYVCRDGRDACCSFFHHLSSQRKKAGDSFVFNGSFAEFHKKWVSGGIEFGRWTDHIASWDNATTGVSRVLFLTYEEMSADLPPCVERIAAHLGLDAVLSKNDIDDLIPTFSFAHMKSNREQFQPTSVTWKDGFEFLRKGVKGDHGTLYGPEEIDAYDAALRERFPDGPPSWAKLYKPSK